MRRLPEQGVVMEKLSFDTDLREEMKNVTDALRDAVARQHWQDGVLVAYCPHTTCGLTINEGFDPDVAHDMTRFFHERVPEHGMFRHAEGNADAHIKTSLFGSSVTLIVERGELMLGTWQAVWLFEGDGPRTRQIWLKWLPA